MMRSLFSGVSGLRNHQTRMDVIGNNISNVNTVGYKSSRVIFQDIFSQNISAGMANSGTQGGTNPIQVGLGISLSTIDVIHTRSAFQRTDRPTDMMINGDGFFVVRSPDGDFFTRAGNFTIDDEGFLVTSQGFFVMGYTVPLEMGVVDHGRDEIPAWPTAAEIHPGNPDATPPIPRGDWLAPLTGTPPTIPPAAGQVQLTIPEGQTIPRGFFRTGDFIPNGTFMVAGEPWPAEAAPATGLTVRAGDPPVPSIDLVLEEDLDMRRNIGIGALRPLQRAVAPQFGLVPMGDPDLSVLSPIRVMMSDIPQIPTPLGLEISSQLEWMANPTPDDGRGDYVIDWDSMGTTMEAFFGQFPMGDVSLPNFAVADNGDISVLSGGRNVVIARLAVAMFSNPAGLEVAGGNIFRQTASSGEAIVGQAGLEGAGAINGGGLEMSNVDMADQFTDMIVTQRGFQANSRIISTTDEMLQEIVNLRR